MTTPTPWKEEVMQLAEDYAFECAPAWDKDIGYWSERTNAVRNAARDKLSAHLDTLPSQAPQVLAVIRDQMSIYRAKHETHLAAGRVDSADRYARNIGVLQNVLDRLAANPALPSQEVPAATFRQCLVCNAVTDEPIPHDDDWKCGRCGQGYMYLGGASIDLTDEQADLLFAHSKGQEAPAEAAYPSWREWVASLPAPMRANILESAERGESLTHKAFLAGYSFAQVAACKRELAPGEREEFEAWATWHGYDLAKGAEGHDYADAFIRDQWTAWSARATWPATPPPPMSQEPAAPQEAEQVRKDAALEAARREIVALTAVLGKGLMTDATLAAIDAAMNPTGEPK